MNPEDTACFPPLACRMIANPAKGVEMGAKPLRIPPFSEIDLKNWDGFFFSHLRWTGFKYYDRGGVKYRDIQREPWENTLIYAHEIFGHEALSDMLFPQLKKYGILGFYCLMAKICEEKHE